MNQNPLMPPTQGPSFQSAVAQPATSKYPTKPGISPAVQALMNAQAAQTQRQGQLGPRQPAPGARAVVPGQQFQGQPGMSPQFQDYQNQLDQATQAAAGQRQMLSPQAMSKPAAYQPPAADPTMPVTAPQPMPFQRVRGDAASTARAQFDPNMEQRMRAFGPRVR